MNTYRKGSAKADDHAPLLKKFGQKTNELFVTVTLSKINKVTDTVTLFHMHLITVTVCKECNWVNSRPLINLIYALRSVGVAVRHMGTRNRFQGNNVEFTAVNNRIKNIDTAGRRH